MPTPIFTCPLNFFFVLFPTLYLFIIRNIIVISFSNFFFLFIHLLMKIIKISNIYTYISIAKFPNFVRIGAGGNKWDSPKYPNRIRVGARDDATTQSFLIMTGSDRSNKR